MDRILVTCPPMINAIDLFEEKFRELDYEVTCPKVVQTLSVQELKELVPGYEGWIIGDDQATREVFAAGKAGHLKAAVKWGVGVDNVDFKACADLQIPITNTPNVFGDEVADVAMGYVIALARETFQVDRGIRQGSWPKPCGISLLGRTAGLIGYGDVGRKAAQRMLASGMNIIAYDPLSTSRDTSQRVEFAKWPDKIDRADFIVITCSLTDTSFHLINEEILEKTKQGVRIVNVGRGPVIDEGALELALRSGQVHSAALDVFETEPLPRDSLLFHHPRCIFGSHNASNTIDGVMRTSNIAIEQLSRFLNDSTNV